MDYRSNIQEQVAELKKALGLLLDPVPLLKEIATSMVPVLRTRIHENGLDATGTKIGTYSAEYLKRRQRPPYNRTADSDIVFSLTRQMEGDMKAVPTEQGWGIGYSNQINYDKAVWAEKNTGKKIFTDLTPDEEKIVLQIVDDYTKPIIDAIR